MNSINIDLNNVGKFVSYEEILALAKRSARYIDVLNSGTGAGSDFLGWLTLPEDIISQIDRIEQCADHLRSVSKATVIIGIGGSYLGAKAVIEALNHSFASWGGDGHELFFAGYNISEEYLFELMEVLERKDFSIIVISKSGTTTEPAIAFRILKNLLERKVGREAAADRIVAITDKAKGALHTLAEVNGYRSMVIPDNIGGRYSVLTPVGLLPVAVAGFDIRRLVEGAQSMIPVVRDNHDASTNPSLLYAAVRNLLLNMGKSVEILVGFNPKMHYFSEWWKQLFGESEGKDGKGIYPSSVDFTTDLHSLGQYIQQGQRILFETVVSIQNSSKKVVIPEEEDNSDQLNYLAGKRLSEVNRNAELGTTLAHNDGGVPVIKINVPEISEFYLGQLVYFFEMACGISGYILDVNPFDQPGVEAYKKNMFALLNKPGYEEAHKNILKKI